MALTLATQPVQHQPQHEHADQGNSGVDLARPGIVPRHWRTCTCAVTVNVTVHVTVGITIKAHSFIGSQNHSSLVVLCPYCNSHPLLRLLSVIRKIKFTQGIVPYADLSINAGYGQSHSHS
jgi:hypothetical protein